MYAMAHMWESEDNIMELAFYCRQWFPRIKLGSPGLYCTARFLYLLNHLANPQLYFK